MNDLLEQMEKKAFRTFWNDGLLDLMVGLAIVAVGLSWWQDMAVMGAIAPAVCVSMWKPIRQRLVEPRQGFVEFSVQRQNRSRRFLTGMMIFGTALMLLGILVYLKLGSGFSLSMSSFIPALPAALIALMALAFAMYTTCWRYYLYCAVLLGAAAVTFLWELDPGPPLCIAGLIISAVGLQVLIEFLSSHPANPEPES
jgi:hypothetical protein